MINSLKVFYRGKRIKKYSRLRGRRKGVYYKLNVKAGKVKTVNEKGKSVLVRVRDIVIEYKWNSERGSINEI